MKPNTLVAVLLFSLVAGTAAAQPGQDFHWQGFIAPGMTVEIKGVNGNVSAEPASGRDVEVVAVKKSRKSDAEDVRVEVVEHHGGVTVCAVYPTPPNSRRPNECKPGDEGQMNVNNNDVMVQFTIKVPKGVRFVGRTVNGDVETGALDGPLSLTTVNGSIAFSTTSYAEARCVNGGIRGEMNARDWDEDLEFAAVNGSITLTLSDGLNANVDAKTVNGDLSSDFPLTVSGRWSPRRLTGTLGSGGRALKLETVNGSIKLRRR
jgi:DUF4097 and DUF4098 domain-containing protein YvlB